MLFKRKEEEITEEFDSNELRKNTIDYLRKISEKEFTKILEIVKIYREVDERVLEVELGSKKAVAELRKSKNTEVADEDAFEKELAKRTGGFGSFLSTFSTNLRILGELLLIST